MNESEKSRLQHNMHDSIFVQKEYISLSQKKVWKNKYQNVNCSEVVSIFIWFICILYFFNNEYGLVL